MRLQENGFVGNVCSSGETKSPKWRQGKAGKQSIGPPNNPDPQSSSKVETHMQANISNLVTRFIQDEDGAALLEYSILIGLITAGVIGFVTGAGAWVTSKWQALATAGIKK
jgi:pilus assembly protein Flp/PilA